MWMQHGNRLTIYMIPVTFVVALMLTLIPMWEVAQVLWQPAWVALCLIYWCVAAPDRVGVVTGWVVGLLLDGMTGSLLGQHALGLSLVAYATHCIQWREQLFWREGIRIFVVLFFYQALILWSHSLRGIPVTAAAYFISPFINTLAWPVVFVGLRAAGPKHEIGEFT